MTVLAITYDCDSHSLDADYDCNGVSGVTPIFYQSDTSMFSV